MTDKAQAHQVTATTTGMKGQGFYNKNSAPQLGTINHLHSWMEKAVHSLKLPDEEGLLRFADFGCSEGANSMHIMELLTNATRQRRSNPLQIVHSDLPTNDYNTLLHAIGSRERAPYTDPSVFGSIVAGSMFNQLLPPRSLHMSTCFNAIGFFAEHPLERLPDYIMPNGPGPLTEHGSISKEDKEACEQQAEKDLEAFLTARASELTAGGKLLLHSFGRNDQVSTAHGIMDALNMALLDHVESEAITQDDYARYYHPIYLRNLSQLTAPVKPETGPLSHLFTIEKAKSYETPVPFIEQYKELKNLPVFAHQMVSFFRAFTEATLQEILGHIPNMPTLLDSIYARAEERIQTAPRQYQFRYISVAMLLTRTNAD